MFRISAIIVLLLSLNSCKSQQIAKKEVQIAFIADVHLQDIFAKFEDNDYKGIENPKTGEYANIRTMNAQLHSTRIFNENYFAFLEALNDIVKRNIKQVVLPGDFSDDGQPVHVRGLKKILNEYSKKYGLSFYVTTGNHDVVRPFSQDAAKTDFLGKGGKEQIISSSKNNLNKVKSDLEPIITTDIKNWGYKETINEMRDFGFFPKKTDLYWETPFSNYTYEQYNFEKAQKESDLEKRTYVIKNTNLYLPDASYLVEPVKGIWLLAIDANAYVPNEKLSGEPNNPHDFSGANTGYNNVLIYKSHLINWVKKVSAEAKQKGKILIAFSHYPMVEFNDDASPELKQLFGANKMQLQRVPDEEVAQQFADAGIQIHFGGHMHINDTGVRTTAKGNTLFNIQTPSLAAYMPAYKILTIHSNSEFEVETIVIGKVDKFDSLFPFYEEEYAYLQSIKDDHIWNKEILNAKNYKEFTNWHLKELVRLRFLPEDFPADLLKSIEKISGKDLLELNKNTSEINKDLKANSLTLSDFESWTGFDMIFDFYRLKSADELAFSEIGKERLKQYELICKYFKKSNDPKLVLWAEIFWKTMNGEPSDHFKIDLKNNKIDNLSVK
ncbi:3',5'-cyclic AMP phosphodiesterase CpdA [Flavobacterium nitrogenifigens]|uniref:3',5'-cyclic AMP phosphodiesterase CpdA n=2 Tax=Flavobacterium TaxID=237 RepID=A0A7W7J2R8_9FLAO|nr:MULTISPECIES: metallophosphoesterase [Flavobacterium]MBB4804525.1 3',5'-cyclic AMP phosphodiesterase CpdA [Flavobacterium nitrogenifigens]MBB6389484.1 3',5'-cyclic AMP phosphodiesterase CpdA [Flavobacterium notoginsengisoli]